MTHASERAPLLVTTIVVIGLVLLFLYPSTQGPDAAEGRVLSFLRIRDLGPDETCVDTFPIQNPHDRISLNHRFDTAIRPRASLTAPDGSVHEAIPTVQGLQLELPEPVAGNWTLRVWVAPTPGIASHIDQGEVFILGFPQGEGTERQASLCEGTFPSA